MNARLLALLALPALFSLFAATCYAQDPPPAAQVETKTPPGQQSGTISVSAQPIANQKEDNPGVKFTALGGAIARPSIPLPTGATSLLQVAAPLGSSGNESILFHVYKRDNALFADVLTAKASQVWTRRNTVRLLAPYPDHPESLNVTLRYLEPRARRGVMLVASDNAMYYILAFPKGLGATVTQQQFLSTSKNGTQSTYAFGDLDTRGFVIIKATVLNAGGDKPDSMVQYFVWNGTKFIPRAIN